jgi:hypothetical protein
LRLAYADPPYPSNASLYRDHPDYGGEVDHRELLARLAAYDGWALSTSAAALPSVLTLCPPGVRVASWYRGPRAVPSWQPVSAWEPVIYLPGRPVDPADGLRTDALVHGIAPMTTLPGRVVGTKPAVFCRWVFELLGAAAGDSLNDLFPGSGAVGRAWAVFTNTSRGSAPDTSPTTVVNASSPASCDPSSEALCDASCPAAPDASLPRAEPSSPAGGYALV